MSRTPRGAIPDGKVEAFVPRASDLWLFKNKEISVDKFRDRYVSGVKSYGIKLGPGKLMWAPFSFFEQKSAQLVEPGDALFYALGKNPGDEVDCHGPWAAAMLAEAGWAVVLNGEVYG